MNGDELLSEVKAKTGFDLKLKAERLKLRNEPQRRLYGDHIFSTRIADLTAREAQWAS